MNQPKNSAARELAYNFSVIYLKTGCFNKLYMLIENKS